MQGIRPVFADLPFAAAISPGVSILVQIGVIMVIFYLLLIRPQQRRQKEHQKMLGDLQKGDRILTTGGFYASVLNVKDNIVVASLAENVKVEIAKSAVAARVEAAAKK
jgi:preprotein translocase subunit YajC